MFAQEMDLMADGNLLFKAGFICRRNIVTLKQITFSFIQLCKCFGISGKKKLDVKKMKIECYDTLYALMTLNEKLLVRQKFSVICPVPRNNFTNYLHFEIKCYNPGDSFVVVVVVVVKTGVPRYIL